MTKSKPRILIRGQSLSKTFTKGKKTSVAIRDVNLEVEKGDFVAISGTSGSGKSTLLSILGLLETPSSGEYELAGVRTNQLKESQLNALRNRKIGLVFQNFNLLNDLTVAQNVCLPLRYNSDLPSSVYHERVASALSDVGLLDYAEMFPSELSGGQQQRVAVARAIVNRPGIILADEPTGNLDKKNTQRVMALLNTLHRQGATIVIVTHDLDIAGACRIHYQMDDGVLSMVTERPPLTC